MAQGLTGEQAFQLTTKLEELSIPSDKIDEILLAIDLVGHDETSSAPTDDVSELAIKQQLLTEPDWRKRASLAAMLISRSL